MAKRINVEIPRSALKELALDVGFGERVHNAILECEVTKESVPIAIGKSAQKATVSIVE